MTTEEDTLSTEMVLEATGGTLLQGDPQAVFTGVSTDSRSIRPGDLFFALQGEHFDGHRFMAEALRKGARGGIVDREGRWSADQGVPIIQVTDTLRALGDLAHRWRKRHPIPLIAVVGSTGKTTTKEMTAKVLERTEQVLKNPGNLNNLIGLPLSLLTMNSSHRAAVLELGMNRPGEIRRLAQIAEPDLGIITNVGSVHLEGVGSLEGVKEAKGELLEGMGEHGRLIFNADDPLVVELSKRFGGHKTSFGITSPAHWTATDIIAGDAGGISFQLAGPPGEISVALQFMGGKQVYNALAAAAAASHLGVGLEDIKEGLAACHPPPMRMELITLGQGTKIINDAYNANPHSMEFALNALREVTGGRKIAVLGDMWELGEYAVQAHRELGRSVKEHGIDILFLLGRFAPQVAHGAQEAGMQPGAVFIGKDHHEVSRHLAGIVRPGDWVLIKGSRIMIMEEIIEELRDIL